MSNPFAKARAVAERFRADGAPTKRVPTPAAKQAAGIGELFIYESIGADFWSGGGVTGKSVTDQLAEMKGCKVLNIYINCEGGDVFEAKAIYSALKRFDAQKVVHIDGIAASAATFVAMAGDKIITSPVATWMVHQAWTVAMGPAADLRATADLLDLENQTIAETYAKRTGGSVAAMAELMAATTWMNAATALELGFTDEVLSDASCTCDCANCKNGKCSCAAGCMGAGNCTCDCANCKNGKCSCNAGCCGGAEMAALKTTSTVVALSELTQSRLRGTSTAQRLAARITNPTLPGLPGKRANGLP